MLGWLLHLSERREGALSTMYDPKGARSTIGRGSARKSAYWVMQFAASIRSTDYSSTRSWHYRIIPNFPTAFGVKTHYCFEKDWQFP